MIQKFNCPLCKSTTEVNLNNFRVNSKVEVYCSNCKVQKWWIMTPNVDILGAWSYIDQINKTEETYWFKENGEGRYITSTTDPQLDGIGSAAIKYEVYPNQIIITQDEFIKIFYYELNGNELALTELIDNNIQKKAETVIYKRK